MTKIRAAQITSESAADGFVLTADGAGVATWEAAAGGGALDDLSDVTITTPGTGQVLTYDGAGWVNDDPPAGGVVDASDVTYTPAVSADWDGDADPGNADAALNQLAERVDDLEGAAGDPGEGHITILPMSYSAIGQGDWVLNVSTSSILASYISQATPGNADNISYKVYLAAGTYSLLLYYHKNTTGGVMDIDIDATEVGSVDQYGSLTYNQRYLVTNISIATSGLKTLKLRMDGKNGSSSNYKGWCAYLALWRTA